MVHKNMNNYRSLDDILKSLKKTIEKQLDSLKKGIENKLDKLKEKIGKNIDNTFYYYFKNENEIIKLENKIIELINEEIDKSKFKNLNLKENLKFEINKGNQNVSNSLQSQVQSNTLDIRRNRISTNPKTPEKMIDLNSSNNKETSKRMINDYNINQERVVLKSKIDQENNLNQSVHKIEKLDYFTSKDIQEENKEITREFQKEALDYIEDDEEKENKNIAYYLELISNGSRRAYNSSNELFNKMFDEFSKTLHEKKDISTLNNDEQFRKEFSSWVKEYEKAPEGKQKYKNYFKDKGIFYKNENISTLFPQLTKLYFHCELSFPIVDIDFNDFKSGIPFNHETMIDFINKGKNRKVNFVILPSLISNGNFLENGKYWVFTYKRDTFSFSELTFEKLIDKKEKFNPIYRNKNLLISQTNNKRNNSLSKKITNSNRTNNSRGFSTNTKNTSKENLKKEFKHYKIKYDNFFKK